MSAVSLLLALADGREARLLPGEDLLRITLDGQAHALPRLPDAVLKAQLDQHAAGTELSCSGWAIWEEDRRPPALICLADGTGLLHVARRLPRPDIRAMQRLDFDMTGFAASCPVVGEGPAQLVFLGTGGGVCKPLG